MAQTRTEAKLMQNFYDSIDQSLLATYKRNQPERINQEDFKNISKNANVPLDYVIRRFDAISSKGDIDPLLKDTKRKGDRGGRAAMKDGKLVEIDETYSNIKSSLSKKQDRAIQNIIAQKRIKDYSVLGRGMNMADKATSLAVRGNTDIVIESPNEKQMYISLAQQMIDGEKRTKKASGNLVGNQKKLDADGSGSIDANDLKMLRNSKQEGGEMNQQMDMLMGMEQEQPMLPDEEMEEDYVDYVVEETLSNEDRNYLIDALEKDDRLSMIFDQVVESATEFTGSGPVEGPGTAKSDSIPARLSDGEFVFTTKATEEIGADNLMSMMKDAEAAVDERQQLANGGSPMAREEREVMVTQQEPIQQNINVTKSTLDNSAAMPRQEEDNVRKAINENMMLDPYQKHVRS